MSAQIQMMTAILCPAYGGPEVLQFVTLSRPEPGVGEVRVKVCAAGINFPDILSVAGTYPIPSQPPFVPGVEGAGIVDACGPQVSRLCIGDRVCWQENRRKGGFAEYLVLPEVVLARVPDSVPMDIAASVPTVYGTARFALEHRGGLMPGDWVLIHGASGGVGLAALQLSLQKGARVIALSGNASKRQRLAAMGPLQVLDAERPDLRDSILSMTGGRGVDLALDMVGGAAFDLSIRVLASYGRLLSIGFASGILPVAKANILLVKGISVIGVNYGHYLESEPEAARMMIESILQGVATGYLRPTIGARYPLSSTPQALADLRDRKVFGKAVVSIDGLSVQKKL